MAHNQEARSKKRVLCSYGVDLDAVSIWANTSNGAVTNPTDVSRGIGATVGVDRLLSLFDRNKIRATWFIPAHTLESFPKQVAKIRDSGHEMYTHSKTGKYSTMLTLPSSGLHGYTHERVGDLTAVQERDVFDKSIKTLTSFTGKKPKSWTAPSWKTSLRTVELLGENGIEYDHSFMHHDSQMYYLPYTPSVTETNLQRSATDWMKPMSTIRPSSIVEIPANWHLDDWPALNVGPGGSGFVDPDVLERLWKSQFDFYYREYDTFVFPITIHPQVSGKPHAMLMHERLISYINEHEGVEWCIMKDIATEFRRFPGHVVDGGVDS
ncbi:Polysaccharide deacetylase family protein [Aspergillus sclerotialis]|uniref:Polysaccharide deacetylase family protein n=1 Tax=Aspergillus sclerotialis TaxID=2070753 RepID=A0A3A2ZZR9_9EURO|nr:Polysaccharide deacetylase family protein [Aspergillus sclerotialis]